MTLAIALLSTIFATTSQLSADTQGVLRAGFPMSSFNGSSATDAKIAIDAFLNQIAQGENLELSGVVFDRDADLIAAISAGEIDFFMMNADLYLQSVDKVDMRPVLASVRHSSPVETLLLVARKGDRLSDLKGGSLLIDSSGRGRTPLRWMSDHLLSSGNAKTAVDFFGSIMETNSASHALLPVYFGKHDAALISEGTYGRMCKLNPQIRDRTTIIQHSDPLLSSVICLRADYVEAGAGRLEKIGAKLHTSEEGQYLLSLMRTARLVPFKEEYLLHNRELHNRSSRTRTEKPTRQKGGDK